jgi:hypothetical protein
MFSGGNLDPALRERREPTAFFDLHPKGRSVRVPDPAGIGDAPLEG